MISCKRIFAFIFFTCAFLQAAQSQTKKEIKKATKDRDKFFYSGTIKQSVFDQTIHFQNLRGEIIVTVMINGKPYNFIFDTGAPTLISDDLLKELHLEKTGSFTMNDGTEHKKMLDCYTIKEMQLGDVVFNNTGCMMNNMDDLSKLMCIKVDGVLGVNLMHLCYWKLRFDDSTIDFSSSLQQIPSSAKALNFIEDFGGSPYFKMQYGDSTMYVEFDCGANGPLSIKDTDTNNLKKLSHSFAVGHGATVQTLYQKLAAKQYACIVDSIKIADVTFRNKLVFLTEIRDKSLMGTSFMKNYETILNWKDHKIYMDELTSAIDTTYSRSFGFNFAIDSNKLRVQFVWNGSLAEKDGINVGDEVTAVNDINTTAITDEQYCDIINEITGQNTIKVAVKNKMNKLQTVTLNRYDLVK